jgi:hypothetical protein
VQIADPAHEIDRRVPASGAAGRDLSREKGMEVITEIGRMAPA